MKQKPYRSIKIIEGLNLIHLASDGVEMCIKTKNDEIEDIELYNNPLEDLRTRLSERLMGKEFDETTILDTIDEILK